MKICKRCKQEKPLDEYRKTKARNNREYYQANCKLCERLSEREWYYKNHTLNKEKQKHKARKLHYNLTKVEYESLILSQNSSCAICSTLTPAGRGTWHVDHNHVTGKVRGLLCHKCNTGLGLFLDDPDLLIKASIYLNESK